MTESDNIGALIKKLREKAGLTQGQLAEYARVTRAWLAGVEAGNIKKPEQEKLQQVATILRVPAETLLAAAGYRVTGPTLDDLVPKEGWTHTSRATLLARELLATLERADQNLDVRDPELHLLLWDLEHNGTPEQIASLKEFLRDAVNEIKARREQRG